MSTYEQAVQAQADVEALIDGNDACVSNTVIPQAPPDNFAVQVVCTTTLGLPGEVNGVKVIEVVGIPSASDDELHDGAVNSYQVLGANNGGTTLEAGTVYIGTAGSPLTVSLPRAFITAGEVRVANAGASTLTLEPFPGDTVAGGASLVLGAGDAATLFSDGESSWVRF